MTKWNLFKECEGDLTLENTLMLFNPLMKERNKACDPLV